jgi:hypothetical protein
MNYLPENIKAIIIDVDGGAKDEKPTAEYVGRELIKSQFPFHPIRLYKGLRGLREVKKVIREHENEKNAYGLQKFFEVVGRTLDVDKTNLYEITKKVIDKKKIEGFAELSKKLDNEGIIKFFSTGGYETSVFASMMLFNGRAGAANPLVWYNPDRTEVHGSEITYIDSRGLFKGLPETKKGAVVKNCLMSIKNSEDKRRINEKMVEIFGIKKEEVAILENDKLGHSSMKAFGFPIASPLADQETIDVALENDGIHIKDYMSLVDSN